VSTQGNAVVDRAANYRHLAPLLARLPQCTDGHRTELREQLAMAFLPVVEHIAARYGGRGEPTDDLQQVGTIGLLGALDRFTPPPDATDLVGAFLGFAVPTVTGEIRRHFRDRTWSMRVSRRMKDLQGPIREAVAVLAADLQRAPRPSEIAAHLGVELGEVVEALQAQNAYTPTSLDAPLRADGATIADLHGDIDAALAHVEYRQELRAALDELPARERTMLILRFFGDRTQTQIAEEMGLSQMHVSRMLSRSLATLRRRMAPTDPASLRSFG
jgi:RNA polymerase sigma-B factor